ncbi:MAG TPA: TrkA family potassium uptake protein [Thermoanaerobaculia bacterium]|nr:TrkA family potassium uptake protein [Thermoanaerobaculia bacterium]
MKRVAVVGLGNFGATVAEQLAEVGYRVSALDVDPARVERLASSIREAVVGDGTDPEVLDRIRASDADAAIVSTGDDVTASVLTALALKDLGVPEIHVKVISELHARILDKIGITETVFPERESAELLAKRITNRRILNYLKLGEGFSAQEMTVPEQWVGHSLRELELPQRYNISVIAVHDFLSGGITPIPDPDAPLKDSDTLLVAGADENLARVAALG